MDPALVEDICLGNVSVESRPTLVSRLISHHVMLETVDHQLS